MPAKHETWMPLYIADYLGDTLHLTTEQHGAYLLLLMAAWKRGGHVPDDEAQLAQITRLADRWQTHASATVRAFFTQRDGMLWHDRVVDELHKAEALVHKRSKAGAAGAAAKWQKDGKRIPDAIGGALRPQGQTHTPSPSPSVPEGTEKATRRRAAPFDASQVELPGWIPREAWALWCADRKKRGKAITEAGARMQIKALETYRGEGHAPQAVIEHSIAGGYQGLFPPKAKPGAQGQPAPDPADWRATWRSIVAKGVELGVGEWSEELQAAGKVGDFPSYRARVERAVAQRESGAPDPEGMAKVAALVGAINTRKVA